jgi:hypothetical protein
MIHIVIEETWHMKRSILLVILPTVILFSCKKDVTDVSDNVPASIAGTWKMIVVKDNSTNATENKPASSEGDVLITFVPNSDTTGTLSGNTSRNIITGFGVFSNGYTLGRNGSLAIPCLSMTKVGETSWGKQFVDNIIEAQQYSFGPGAKLNIKTTKKILTFQKQ